MKTPIRTLSIFAIASIVLCASSCSCRDIQSHSDIVGSWVVTEVVSDPNPESMGPAFQIFGPGFWLESQGARIDVSKGELVVRERTQYAQVSMKTSIGKQGVLECEVFDGKAIFSMAATTCNGDLKLHIDSICMLVLRREG